MTPTPTTSAADVTQSSFPSAIGALSHAHTIHTGVAASPFTQVAPHIASSGPGQSVSNLLLTVLLSGAVISAAVAAMVNVVLTRRKSLEEERNRVRATCAEAFQAVAAYKEFPYAIRRRRKDKSEEERARLSDELRHIQAGLSYFTAWMRGEDTALSAAFDELVRNLRSVAGRACHDAWLADPTNSDVAMNVDPDVIDLSELTEYEDAYIAAMKNHLDGLIKSGRLIQLRRH